MHFFEVFKNLEAIPAIVLSHSCDHKGGRASYQLEGLWCHKRLMMSRKPYGPLCSRDDDVRIDGDVCKWLFVVVKDGKFVVHASPVFYRLAS